MTKILAFCNRKGGSGKTTTAVHVAGGLSLLGKRVLLIDCDPQAHASLWLLGKRTWDKGLLDCLYEREVVSDCVFRTRQRNLFVMPASKGLSEFEATYSKRPGAAFLLKRCLATLPSKFDYIVFDTPPYVGLLLVSCLTATQYVFATVPLQFLALDGLFEITGLMKKIREKANKALELKGVIPVMLNRNLKSSWQVLQELKKECGKGKIFPAIRQNVRLSEAPSENKLIHEYAPKSNGAQDYWALTRAIEKELTSNLKSSNTCTA